MKLKSSYLLLAQKLQEADAGLTNSDVAHRLSDQIQDMHRGTGHYANYHDHAGDDKSGDVIYSVDGNTVKAPYELSKDGDGAAKTFIHADKAVNVVPRTVYEPESDQDELDQYAAMQEAKLYTRGPMPLVERTIPKSERDAADSGSFAGKGKSFPILKAEDVAAAAHALGRAGSGNYSTDVIKKNIIRIAKAKGWTAQLPQAWQDGTDSKEAKTAPTKDCPDCKGSGEKGDDDCPTCKGKGTVPAFVKKSKEAKGKQMTDCKGCGGSGDCPQCDGSGDDGDDDCEACDGTGDCALCDGDGGFASTAASESRHEDAAGGLRLVESATTLETIRVKEAKADYEIKLIAPGKGSSAFYPKEVLQRDGPKVFKAGTHVYLNHATAAEEAERPEGDVRNLAGVLTADAVYSESHAKGPGLYGRMKVFADHAQTVEEKAPHVGMSIRASGVAESGTRKEGLPVLKELTAAESVDVVTRAGAGGIILTESARAERRNTRREARQQQPNEEGSMTLQEAQRLIEKAVAPLRERTVKADARAEGARLLETVSLPDAAKARIIERCVESLPMAGNELDESKFREAVVKEAQAEGRYIRELTGGGEVFGMGSYVQEAVDPERQKKLQEAMKLQEANDEAVFGELMGNSAAAKLAAKGRAA